MRVGVLFSGGKDSTYAAYVAKRSDDLRCLITITPARQDSYMFHYPNTRWAELQCEAMDLPWLHSKTEGVKEEELDDLSSAIKLAKEEFSIEGIYSGAIASVYQKTRVDRLCSEAGLRSLSPLWGIEPASYLSKLLDDGFSAVIVGVSALGLDKRWLGRPLDTTTVAELLGLQEKYGLHATFEGGEGETFVLDCPLFKERIKIISSRTHWNGDSGYLEILDARLESK